MEAIVSRNSVLFEVNTCRYISAQPTDEQEMNKLVVIAAAAFLSVEPLPRDPSSPY